METFGDFAPLVSFLAAGQLPLTEESFAGNRLELDEQKKLLQFALWRLEALRSWNKGNIFATVKELSTEMDIKLKDFNAPLFVAISGTTASFSVMDAMDLLGPDLSRARLRHAIDILGGAGKKVLKRWEKEYAALG